MTFTTFRQLHLRLLAILLCADCKSRISSIGSPPQGGGKRLMFLPVLELEVETRSHIFTFRTVVFQYLQVERVPSNKHQQQPPRFFYRGSFCNCGLGCYETKGLTRSKHVTCDLRTSGAVGFVWPLKLLFNRAETGERYASDIVSCVLLHILKFSSRVRTRTFGRFTREANSATLHEGISSSD